MDALSSARRPGGDSVRPVLDLLAQQRRVRSIYRQVDSLEELDLYTEMWVSRWRDYDLGYFAFHADRGQLKLGRRWLGLEEFADGLEGEFRGKVVLFAGCSILNTAEDRVAAFLVQTQARVVCGYRRYVFTLEAAAFELLLLDAFADYESPLRNAVAPVRRVLKSHRSTAERLGFRAYHRSGSEMRRVT